MQTTKLKEAIDLFNQQEFFECHEILEDLWRPLEPGQEKTFLQGVLQVAVGFHHLLNNNFTGARNKLTEGLEKLESVQDSDYATGIELGAFIQSSRFSLQCLNGLGAEGIAKFPRQLIPRIG